MGRMLTRAETQHFGACHGTSSLHQVASFESAKLMVDGSDAVMLGQFTQVATKSGRRFTLDVAFRLVVKDGKIVRLHMYEDTLAAARAFDLS